MRIPSLDLDPTTDGQTIDSRDFSGHKTTPIGTVCLVTPTRQMIPTCKKKPCPPTTPVELPMYPDVSH
ncbi:hypothetical protein AAHC03_013769 [Spirometra sp. Aus1]